MRLKYLHASKFLSSKSLEDLLDAGPHLEHLLLTGLWLPMTQWSGYHHPNLKCSEVLADHIDDMMPLVLKTALDGFPALREVWAYRSRWDDIFVNLPALSQPGILFEVLKEGTSYLVPQFDVNASSLSFPGHGSTLSCSEYSGVFLRIIMLTPSAGPSLHQTELTMEEESARETMLDVGDHFRLFEEADDEELTVKSLRIQMMKTIAR